ncbi:MAG TPA: hypothetical protein VK404_07610 [Spirosoma sp.]|nr:hypothetical protein [Spirosoma sp.]
MPVNRICAFTFGCLLIGITLCRQPVQAQGYWANSNYKNGLRLYLNKDSTSFIRLLMWSQIWFRWQQQNPGTSIAGNNNVPEAWDVGIRRSRILLHGQLTPRILVFWIIGANNQTFTTGGGGLLTGPDGVTDGKRQSVFVHDAWTEFKASRALSFGAGLLTWSGLSRLSSAATLNFMTFDSPLYGWALLDANDQFARTLGLYAKGEIGKLSYRAILTKPFTIPEAATGWTTPYTLAQRTGASPMTTLPGRGAGWAAGLTALPNAYNISQYNSRSFNKPLYQLYTTYDFFEQESQTLPFMVGSYLGTKKVFNIGAGFMIQPDAMWHRSRRTATPTLPASVSLNAQQTAEFNAGQYPATVTGFSSIPEAQRIALMTANVDTTVTAMRHFAVDSFLDLPFGSGEQRSALTAYAVHYWFDYGPNYVRNAGTMNLATAATQPGLQPQSFNGPGNAYPTWGTGRVFHIQAGYMFPKAWTRRFGQFQPYVSYTRANFERLNQPHNLLEGGMNWLLAGHNAKITVHYRPRPIYSAATNETPGREGLGGMRIVDRQSEIITQFFIFF